MDDKALLMKYRFAVRQSVQLDVIRLIASISQQVFEERLGRSVKVEYEHPLPDPVDVQQELEQDLKDIVNSLFLARYDEIQKNDPDKAGLFLQGQISKDRFLGKKWQKQMLARLAKASRLAVDLEWKHHLKGLGLADVLTAAELQEAKASLLAGLIPKKGLAFPQKPIQ